MRVPSDRVGVPQRIASSTRRSHDDVDAAPLRSVDREGGEVLGATTASGCSRWRRRARMPTRTSTPRSARTRACWTRMRFSRTTRTIRSSCSSIHRATHRSACISRTCVITICRRAKPTSSRCCHARAGDDCRPPRGLAHKRSTLTSILDRLPRAASSARSVQRPAHVRHHARPRKAARRETRPPPLDRLERPSRRVTATT